MGGSFRFLQRVWTLAQEVQAVSGADTEDAAEIMRITHKVIKKVSQDLETMSFNTAIAAMMEAVNGYYAQKTTVPFSKAPATWRWAMATFVQLLAPFAPHITEELWQQLGGEGSIHTSQWPTYDEKYLVSDTMKIVVQVNGKVRAEIELPASTEKDTVIAAAQANERIATYLTGHEVKKTIYVPNKLVSFVV
jgi:leucyl-tRNA synthetase